MITKITIALMERLFTTKVRKDKLHKYNLIRYRDELIKEMNRILPLYGITTYLRICAFLGNCGIETDYFRTTEEYASGADYEGRLNLGNTVKGDGRRFKGRDLTQTTGRFNYWRVLLRFVKKLTGKDYSKTYLQNPGPVLAEANRLGVNFIEHPELLKEIRFAVESACIFWDAHNLNAYADKGGDDLQGIAAFKKLSAIVNRGDPNKMPLHWSKRKALYEKCLAVVPKDIRLSQSSSTTTTEPAPEPPTTPSIMPTVTSVPGVTDTMAAAGEPTAPAEEGASGTKLDLEALRNKYDTVADKAQQPAVKNVLARVGAKLAVGFSGAWGTTEGKIAIVLSALVILAVAGWALYTYRKKIQIGYEIAKETILDSFRNAFGGKSSTEA